MFATQQALRSWQSPEGVVLDEERVSAGFQHEVLREGLRDVLQTKRVTIKFRFWIKLI